MFDVGFQEITLIGVIALIVVGPERLPKMARTIGLWMGKIRYYVGQVKSDIEREVRAQELKEMLDKPARELDDLYKVAEETKGTLDEAKGALGEAKAALESEPAGISTPNEPAAGSIFPTELPAPGPAAELPAPGVESEPAGPPRDAPGTVSTEVATAAPDTPGTVSAETVPVESDTPDGGSAETAPVASDTPDAVSIEAAPMGPDMPDRPGAGSAETPPVQAGAEEASPAEAETREHHAVPVATDAGENDERSSGRI